MTSHSKLLRAREVAEMLGVSESAIHKWTQQGRFPKAVRLGEDGAKRVAVRWLYDDILAWIEERKNDPDTE